VDDDADTRELLRALLVDAGATVSVFDAARPARAALERAWPDVIVTDIAMPDEDGYAFLRVIRSLQRGDVPVIALTADATEPTRSRARAAGFDRYVAKPIDPAEFLGLVATLARRPLADG
jgi:CheY-like chemotaxis protein